MIVFKLVRDKCNSSVITDEMKLYKSAATDVLMRKGIAIT